MWCMRYVSFDVSDVSVTEVFTAVVPPLVNSARTAVPSCWLPLWLATYFKLNDPFLSSCLLLTPPIPVNHGWIFPPSFLIIFQTQMCLQRYEAFFLVGICLPGMTYFLLPWFSCYFSTPGQGQQESGSPGWRNWPSQSSRAQNVLILMDISKSAFLKSYPDSITLSPENGGWLHSVQLGSEFCKLSYWQV